MALSDKKFLETAKKPGGRPTASARPSFPCWRLFLPPNHKEQCQANFPCYPEKAQPIPRGGSGFFVLLQGIESATQIHFLETECLLSQSCLYKITVSISRPYKGLARIPIHITNTTTMRSSHVSGR